MAYQPVVELDEADSGNEDWEDQYATRREEGLSKKIKRTVGWKSAQGIPLHSEMGPITRDVLTIQTRRVPVHMIESLRGRRHDGQRANVRSAGSGLA
ncbi:hypothetical protein FRB96_005308 [Tulasnella sp. 330]|nr:hypothetical protein FRB96_005308 [Tulasnella sp. 330]